MKTIKINFCGFWKSFNMTDNVLYNLLSKRYNVEITDYPDYVFVSPLGKAYDFMKYNGIRIFYTGEEIVPDFNLFDYAIGFDNISFGDRYVRFPFCYFNGSSEGLGTTLNRERAEQILSEKDIFCNLIFWEDSIGNMRSELFRAINSYKRVEAYGRLLNNVGGNGVSYSEKYKILKRSKFTIAVEGCKYKGITTEKVFQPFEAHSIPIYYGNPDIGKDFSEKAFINCHKYNDIESIVERIIELDKDDEKYLEMLCEKPLLTDNQIEMAIEKLKFFLYNIFDQDLDTCKRRVDSIISRNYSKNIDLSRRFINNKFVYKWYQLLIRSKEL